MEKPNLKKMSSDRRSSPLAGPRDALRRYLRVGKADMRDFHALLESYEGLTTMRTVDAERCIVELDVAPDMAAILERLLDELRLGMEIEDAKTPSGR